jgi:hypothetical protein
MGKFDAIKEDDLTTILLRLDSKLDEYDIRYEAWVREGISAESVIFIEEELNGMNDETLKDLVRALPGFKSGSTVTISRNSNGFAFVNFNFKPID